mmetsp:Transcript_10429/g.25078  ORF Transcript_10429/g.25078 Transcript_10429/m.25078 type:complete len:276 (-) Transcript_10429:382-1209(-)
MGDGKRGRLESDEDSSSSSSSSSSSRRRDRKHSRHGKDKKHRDRKHSVSREKRRSSKEKKRSRDKDRDKARDKEAKRHKSGKKKHHNRDKDEGGSRGNLMGSWGKYGVVRDEKPEGSRYETEFNAWMQEVQGVGAAALAQWEVMEHWKTFCEDFNTGTLPDKKYYDMRKWLLTQREAQPGQEAERTSFDDEAEIRRRRAEQQKAKEQAISRETLMRMGATNAIQNMREQELAKQQMQHAWRTGDNKRAEEMLKRFEPETDKEKWQRLKAEARALG